MRLLYTILLYLIQPLIWFRLLWRSRKIPGYRKRLGERYGFYKGEIKKGGIMLHSVSVGETLTAIPLVRALRYHYPDVPITITTMTPTGSERVLAALGQEVHHVYLPYDLPGSMKRFFNRVQPKLVIVMETEIWPNMINQLYKKKIPLVIANARLSERSAKGYQKIGGMIKTVFRQITLIAAQNAEDGERFVSLGVKRSHLAVTGSLKFDIAITPEMATKALTLRRQWAPHRPVWIAASTHEGEEAIVLQAHRRLLEKFPNLLLVLIPRHPERFSVAKQITTQNGLKYIMRSSGEIPSENEQVVIVDTMGELILLYGIGDLAFVGGSLVERGGHNPLEPAAHSIPIIMGPYTFNFKDICHKLSTAGGLLTIQDENSLVECVTHLLNDKKYRRQIGNAAIEVLRQNQGALERLIKLLEPYLPPPYSS